MASVEATTPLRRSLRNRYACAACNGEGFLDEGRYRELTETPGPLFLSVSQRPTTDREETPLSPPYILTVTNKNAKRERDRRRREEAGATEPSESDERRGTKRLKSAHQSSAAVVSREDAQEWDEDNDRPDRRTDDQVISQVGDGVEDQVREPLNDESNDQAREQLNDNSNDQLDDPPDDRPNDHSDGQDNGQANSQSEDQDEGQNHDRDIEVDDDEDGTNESTMRQPSSPSPNRVASTHSILSHPHEEQQLASASVSAPISTPVEEIGQGVVRSDRIEAEALLRLGLGKDEPAPATRARILDITFAVAGPAAMEDIIGLCRRWREGLICQTGQDTDRKTTALRAEWDARLPESQQKSAIITVQVSAYWALSDDTDGFVRTLVRRRRLADFYEAFEELLRPKTKPNAGWKKKHAEVMKTRLTEAHPNLEPDDEEYKRAKERFQRCLQFGERWARLRREFGSGMFALLPSVMVTNKWVERTLSAVQFEAWFNVMKRHNRPNPTIVDRVGQLVDMALGGARPPVQLRLEGASPADIARDCCDPAMLYPVEDIQLEEDPFFSEGEFLDEIEIT
jgi:hypothetical protein